MSRWHTLFWQEKRLLIFMPSLESKETGRDTPSRHQQKVNERFAFLLRYRLIIFKKFLLLIILSKNLIKNLHDITAVNFLVKCWKKLTSQEY
jgi:hypothetical protein